MAAPLPLPRSAVLACWLGVGGDLTQAAAAVIGEDEPHHVVGHNGPHGLTSLLAGLLGAGPLDVALLLPAPGDPMLADPAALAAGEAVAVRTADGASQLLVPDVRRFGSDLEPGHHVAWTQRPVPDWRLGVLAACGDPAAAGRELDEALRQSTSALLSLDVAHWPAQAAEQIVAVRDGALPARRLPPGLSGPRLRMATTAARLRATIALAAGDHEATRTVFAADQRATALREIDRAARHALAAAATFVRPMRAA